MTDPIPISELPIHYRSIFLFISYLSLITFFSLVCCRTISARYRARQRNNDWASPQRRGQFFLFSFLTAASLGSTWYYMISLFFYSYNTWATGPEGQLYSGPQTPLFTRMGLWLNKTYIFQEAWETVSENPERVWWSAQIFGWTIGWSLLLGITGRRYHIPHVWIYMLVAQAVSVSFAANLFFAAITVSPRPSERDPAYAWRPPALAELIPIALSLADTLAVPIYAYEKGFMLILLAPHFLVFIPCILGPRQQRSPSTSVKAKPSKEALAKGYATTRRYATFIKWVGVASVALQGYLTYLVVQDFGADVSYAEIVRQVLGTVYAHPACSSVSWDVIMCTVSAAAWAVVHGFDAEGMLGGL
ncbi:hypothetical protein BJY01DRAFT_84893 [Aspergillus pseudoustus]|uniref:Uncharacterized protein n=1 Tax=Aspergillus pseudoustus TaxID=1810923 RepID=A0ABR4J246_9EURO